MSGRTNSFDQWGKADGTEEVLSLSRELIRIPSVYTNERDISRFIHTRLRKWGLAPKYVDVPGHGPNVVAEIGDRSLPAIVLNGHMDTVEVVRGWRHDPFGAKVENGRLYGLGALDMKCGVAAMMIAIRRIAESEATEGFRVVFQAVTGEEDSGIGTDTLIAGGWFKGARAVIVGEGFGGLGALTNGRRGGSRYEIQVIGKSAHGATPQLGINAVVDASRVVSVLGRMKMKKAKGLLSDLFEPLVESQMIQRINGGAESLSVPDKCTIGIVRATLPNSKLDVSPQIRSTIKKLVLRSKVEVQFMNEPGDILYPFLTPPSSDLVRIASRTIEEVTGKKPTIVCGVSECDDNLIVHKLKLPTISMGPGEPVENGGYHQAEESIEVSQLGYAARIYFDTMLHLGSRISVHE